MEIREAIQSDAAEIQVICENDLDYSCSQELVKKRLVCLDKERECVFVAVSDSKITGFIHVEKYKLLYCPSMVNVLGIAVKSEYRRQGIGRKLLDVAEDWAKEREIAVMRLNSGAARKAAHHFYQSAGYHDVKEQFRFIKRIEL